ncbi:DNA-formamidopyrimidine glycosylase [Lyngbya confervoides]|uniref:Formamidopyrimidine-DNA glycosylase n=1 Tax=Lyngbya confervoides BDU141951 TaxID=1574623 RepID=A0ABD4SYL1_9CYAN|nr:DNA-formamidopyrimidine glycosylase [Lyngbya confervoides]MCM1981504.1 DNA-formamidopyrimidine glycosylase [Lyngbya confervoides BDU141951]
MPELPEVETVRRGLETVTLHHPILEVVVLYPRSIGHPTPQQFVQALPQAQIQHWDRRGKYLLAHLIGPEQTPLGVLGAHLRMSGQLLWLAQDEPLHKHTRVRFLMTQGQELRFVDQRTFGQLWWVPSPCPPESIITGLQGLGPEPFSADFSLDYLCQALCDRSRPIKTALLDQRLVAGVGNIYADEALFHSGIHPATRCAHLQKQQIRQLWKSVRHVLQAGIKAGGTSFSTFTGVTGINGNYGGEAWVYGRKAHPCKVCHTPIEQIKLAGRSAHFCPTCQRQQDP